MKRNKGVYLIKDEERGPIYTQWRYEAVFLLLLQTILVFCEQPRPLEKNAFWARVSTESQVASRRKTLVCVVLVVA